MTMWISVGWNRYRGLLLAGLVLSLSGCTEMAYYAQAVSGQRQLLSLRRPLDTVLADPATPSPLRLRLETAQALRDFASSELALPDNRSYRSYADLQRPYVVWNVFATPELSLELRQWCFPLVGCVSYRGYFNAAAAQRLANNLRAQGDDVYLGGVPAYSTLGWFDDPLLNTFVHWPIGRLAELVFHELAHQRLFIPNDTVFNESFATTVGQLGTRLWLTRHGTPEEQDAYEQYLQHYENFLVLVSTARDELARLYASNQPDEVKREAKRHLLTGLQARYQALRAQGEGLVEYEHWLAEDLNNAKLAALNTYTHYVPAFEVLFEQSGRDFAAFYRAVEALGGLAPQVREARLQALLTLSEGDDDRHVESLAIRDIVDHE